MVALFAPQSLPDSLTELVMLSMRLLQSSADAGERLATLRGHYEQHIKELGQQLAQQDVQFHAALAARSCSAVNSGCHRPGSLAPSAIVPQLSLEEALADPLGSQGPSLFTLPPRDNNTSPLSDGAGGNAIALDSSHSPAPLSKRESMPDQGLMLRPKGADTFVLSLASDASGPNASSVTALHPHQQAHVSRSAESQIHASDSSEALQEGSSPAIPVFVLYENENPWL